MAGARPGGEGLVDLNAGALAPVADEATLTTLAVTGSLPADLAGTLIRNGPNPFTGAFEGTGMLDWWPEAAMVHGIRLREGAALEYANRWIRTRQWAGHFDPDSATAYPETNPNVNVIRHAGRVLALAEGGPPVALHAGLETGPVPAGLEAGITAHPKLDPESGELIWFRSSWAEPYLVYGVSGADGRVAVEQTVDLPGPAMMHDCAITEHYSLLLDGNVAYDLSLFEKGLRIPIRWFDERTARLGVIPRAGGAVRWFTIAPCFIQHVANAYEEEDRLVLDAVRYDHFLRLDAGSNDFEANPLGRLWRYEIDLVSSQVRERPLADPDMEMPRINEARTGRRHRFVYGVLQPSDREMRGVVKVDVENGAIHAHVPPVNDQNSEPVFVPDPGRPGAEDGGWLLFCAYRAATDSTDLVVLDAQQVEAPPVASVHLPRRIPAGFHGSWLADI